MTWSESNQMSLAWRPPAEARRWRGGVGVVEALCALLEGAGVKQLDRDEAIALTSAGFKHYLYDQALNPEYEPPRRFSYKGDLFSNFGIFESFGQHTGWEILELNFLSLGALSALLAFELGQNRPALTWLPERREAVAIVGLSASATTCVVSAVDAFGEQVEIDVRGQGGSLQGASSGEEDLVNWCVVARPSEAPPWGLDLARRRDLVLRWAVKHARHSKEFFHETRENYAVGLWAYARLIASLERWDEEERGDPQAYLEYIASHVSELRRGRQALAARLGAWGEAGSGAARIETYERVARRYGAVSEALCFELSLKPDQAEPSAWARQLERAAEAETEAIEQLELLLPSS